MTKKDEKLPNPGNVEKEISEFLSEKFGGRVKLITPMMIPDETGAEKKETPSQKKKIDFSIKL